MIRLLLAFLTIGFMVGCVGGDDKDPVRACPSSHYSSDILADRGILIKAMQKDNYRAYTTTSEIEDIYKSIERCIADTHTPGPTIEFISFRDRGLGPIWGAYMPVGQTIYINVDDIGIGRNCYADRATLRHEMAHHVLYMNGRDWSHASSAFNSCDATGPKVCNGTAC